MGFKTHEIANILTMKRHLRNITLGLDPTTVSSPQGTDLSITGCECITGMLVEDVYCTFATFGMLNC